MGRNGRRSGRHVASTLAETATRIGKAVEEKLVTSKSASVGVGSKDAAQKARQAEKDAQHEKSARAIALRCAVVASLEGVDVRGAARHNGVTRGEVHNVESQLLQSGLDWVREGDGSERPYSVTMRTLGKLCGVEEQCTWLPEDMIAVLKLILLDKKPVSVVP